MATLHQPRKIDQDESRRRVKSEWKPKRDFYVSIIMSSSSTNTTSHRPAPQLLFDDGSRAIQEDAAVEPSVASSARDPSIPTVEYYEIDRLVQELVELQKRNPSNNNTWKNRIALQFPDELLVDAPDVCWEFEQRLPDALVFVLGDTTYQSCCPDVVAANHLNADCIVHFGHACLSHATMPVLYSFGKQAISIARTTTAVLEQLQLSNDGDANNLLILYEVQYAHAMSELKEALRPHFQTVLLGKVPSSHTSAATTTASSCAESSCGCAAKMTVELTEEPSSGDAPGISDDTVTTDTLILGGLEIPSCENWPETTLLFVGQDEASRPLQNIMLRFLTDSTNAPAAYWTWNPVTEILSTRASSALSRLLNRRFYLVQKAKLARIFGILVANPSDSTTRPVIRHLQALLQAHGAAQYNFMVGKVNPNKLANFAEVDAYCLVACPEHALLENERSDYATPILTPLEVAMALGCVEWGSLPYSLDARDFLKETMDAVEQEASLNDNDTDNEDDAPYYNPVTGRFESALRKDDTTIDLKALPGKGQITTYQSAAADFLRQRTYQGLSVDAGETKVQAAVEGQQGIASDYGNR